MSTLYKIENNYKELLYMLEDPEFCEEAVTNTMELIEGEAEEKLINYAKIIKSIEGSIEPIDKEKERLDNMKKTRVNKVKRMKKAMESMMLTMGKDKIKTDLFIFNIQANAPSLSIDTENNIPKDYYIEQEAKLDRQKLLKNIKAGLEVEGVKLSQTKSLRIR